MSFRKLFLKMSISLMVNTAAIGYINFKSQSNTLAASIHSECVDPACASKLELFQRSAKLSKRHAKSEAASESHHQHHDTDKSSLSQCPIDREELGKSTWNLLHTIAANLPEEMSVQDQIGLIQLMDSLSSLYPCKICAPDFKKFVEDFPPRLVMNNSINGYHY
jgi:FAD-linked sulfhydryl oxidase